MIRYSICFYTHILRVAFQWNEMEWNQTSDGDETNANCLRIDDVKSTKCVQCVQIIGRLLGRHKHTSTGDGRSRKNAVALQACARWFDDVSNTGSTQYMWVFGFVAMCLSKDKWKSISHLSCSMKMQRKYDTWHIIWINGFDTGPTGSMVYLYASYDMHTCRFAQWRFTYAY